MKRFIAFAFGLILLAGAAFVAPAISQSVVQPTLSGNETWNAGQGPGGPGGFITSDLVRNSTAHALAAMSTGVVVSLSSGGNVLFTVQPAAGGVTLPASPFQDGGIIGLCNVTGSNFATNVVSVFANTGQTLNTTVALTTLAATTCVRLQYHLPTTRWYRIQ